MESVRISESSEERRSDSLCERVSSDLRVSRVRERSSFWAVRDWMVCSLRSSSSYMIPPSHTKPYRAAPQQNKASKERTS